MRGAGPTGGGACHSGWPLVGASAAALPGRRCRSGGTLKGGGALAAQYACACPLAHFRPAPLQLPNPCSASLGRMRLPFFEGFTLAAFHTQCYVPSLFNLP